MLRNVSIYKQTLINALDDVIISIYKSFTPQSNMTTWAIQPSHWGNQVLIGAEMTDNFQTAEDIALDMATDNMEQVCIFKVGTKADIKWKAIN